MDAGLHNARPTRPIGSQDRPAQPLAYRVLGSCATLASGATVHALYQQGTPTGPVRLCLFLSSALLRPCRKPLPGSARLSISARSVVQDRFAGDPRCDLRHHPLWLPWRLVAASTCTRLRPPHCTPASPKPTPSPSHNTYRSRLPIPLRTTGLVGDAPAHPPGPPAIPTQSPNTRAPPERAGRHAGTADAAAAAEAAAAAAITAAAASPRQRRPAAAPSGARPTASCRLSPRARVCTGAARRSKGNAPRGVGCRPSGADAYCGGGDGRRHGGGGGGRPAGHDPPPPGRMGACPRAYPAAAAAARAGGGPLAANPPGARVGSSVDCSVEGPGYTRGASRVPFPLRTESAGARSLAAAAAPPWATRARAGTQRWRPATVHPPSPTSCHGALSTNDLLVPGCRPVPSRCRRRPCTHPPSPFLSPFY